MASAAPPLIPRRREAGQVKGDPTGVRYSGSNLSFDGGLHWRKLDSKGFNAVAFISPTAGWAVGGGGTIARFSGTDADGLTLSLKQQPKPTSEREIRHSICQKSDWSWVPIM